MIKALVINFILISFFTCSLYAECERKSDSNSNSTLIECDFDEMGYYKVLSYTDNNSVTNIFPLYTDNENFIFVSFSGIRVSNDHTINLGSPNGVRIDAYIANLINSSGNETINIYGSDANGDFSELQIGKLTNEYGDVTINGENSNKASINNAVIGGDLLVNNVELKMINAQVDNIYLDTSSLYINDGGLFKSKNIFLDNSNLYIDSSGVNFLDVYLKNCSSIKINSFNINIGDIFLENGSEVSLFGHGSVASISSNGFMNNVFLSGNNTNFIVGDISINGTLSLENSASLKVANNLYTGKISFINGGSLFSDHISADEISFLGKGKSYIEAIDIKLDNIFISNSEVEITADTFILKDSLVIEDSILKINGKSSIENMLLNNSSLISNDSLRADSLLLNDSSIEVNKLQINKKLSLSNSLLIVSDFNFVAFENGSYIDIVSGSKMFYQGDLDSGIYSYSNVYISNNVKLDLTILGSNEIKEGEILLTELIYSKNGEINYSPTYLEMENNGILGVRYYTVEDNGTSFVAEISRLSSYCSLLEYCDKTDSLGLKEENFVNDTANIFDGFIANGTPLTENISNIISGLDKGGSYNLENNILTLKPISNDVLMFGSYQSNRFLKGVYSATRVKDKDSKFSAFSSSGKIKDPIFDDNSNSYLLGAYYKVAITDVLTAGVALSKNRIENSLYDIDSWEATILSSYNINLDLLQLSFLGSYAIDKYDMEKRNFYNQNAKSDTLLQNISLKSTIYQNYLLSGVNITPSLYYDVSYLMLNSYKERGEGYLYEFDSSSYFVQEVGVGIVFSTNIINDKSVSFIGFNLFYLDFPEEKTFAKPYEAMDDYISFNAGSYSGIGISYTVGVNYSFSKNTTLNVSYSGSIYKNNSFFNGLMLSFSV